MFYSGREIDAKELIENIKPSLSVALGGFILPLALGVGLTKLFGGTLLQSLFVGMGISITAIAVQSVILDSMRINKTVIGHIIIGAAIVDDILSLSVLSILLGLTTSQFSALILMAFITTMLAPITLKWAAMRACQSDEPASFCTLWEQNSKK